MIISFYDPSRRSLIHRFDPRVKIVLVLLYVVIFFLPLSILHLSPYLILIALLSVLSLGPAATLRPLRLIFPILLLVLFLTPPFIRQGPALLTIRGFTLVTRAGLLEAGRLIIRFTGISLLFYLFLGTTDPDSLVLALRWFRLPFGVAMVLSVALEYIPYFSALYDRVRDAHSLRFPSVDLAVDFDASRSSEDTPKKKSRRTFRARLRENLPIFTSVIILSVRRIPTLAMVLESRGVGRRNSRTSLHSLKSGRSLAYDALIAVTAAAVLLLSVLLFP
jgi:energy-coupling factor transport system permease protein